MIDRCHFMRSTVSKTICLTEWNAGKKKKTLIWTFFFLLVFSPVICCDQWHQYFVFSLRFVLKRLVFLGISVMKLTQHGSSIFCQNICTISVLVVYILHHLIFVWLGVCLCLARACIVRCIHSLCRLSRESLWDFVPMSVLGSCLVGGGHGGQTICASGYEVRLNWSLHRSVVFLGTTGTQFI